MASKSKRRGRVFRASCILAALIIAGSSFAWFTSKDEVTNRLTASSDYGVSIVESFAPPKNWVPGQEVNKDVYAVNTGNIEAYVKETVKGKLNYTFENKVGTWDKECVTLDDKAINAIDGATTDEAGGFLAWTDAKVDGEPYATGNINSRRLDPNKTDTGVADPRWTPPATGTYIFRRAIGGTNANPTYEYAGYYFVKARDAEHGNLEKDTYYKIVLGTDDFRATEEEGTTGVDKKYTFDVSASGSKLGDGVVIGKDGVITEGTPKVYYVKEKKIENQDAYFTYEDKTGDHPARLVVDFSTALTADGDAYDATADAARKQIALIDAKGQYDQDTVKYEQAKADYEYALALATARDQLQQAADTMSQKNAAVNDPTDGTQAKLNTAWDALKNEANNGGTSDLNTNLKQKIEDLNITGSGTGNMTTTAKLSPNELLSAVEDTGTDNGTNPKWNVLSILQADQDTSGAHRLNDVQTNYEEMVRLWNKIQNDIADINAALDEYKDDTNGDPITPEQAKQYEAIVDTKLKDLAKTLRQYAKAYADILANTDLASYLGTETTALDTNGKTKKKIMDVAANINAGDSSPVTIDDTFNEKVTEFVNAYNANEDAGDELETEESNWAAAKAKYNKDVTDAKTAYEKIVNKTSGKPQPGYENDADEKDVEYHDRSQAIVMAYSARRESQQTGDGVFTEAPANVTHTTEKSYVPTLNEATGYLDDTVYAADYEYYKELKSGTDDVGLPKDGTKTTASNISRVEKTPASSTTNENTTWDDTETVLKDATTTNTIKALYDKVYDDTNGSKKAYEEAKLAYETAKTTRDSSSNIKIYVNLNPDFQIQTTGDDAGMATDEYWQYAGDTDQSGTTPTDKAEFYYRYLLAPGETSHKLVDSVTLADTVTANDYKNLTFDLNVGLDSAQVTYADDQRTITTTAVDANDAFELKVEDNNPEALNDQFKWVDRSVASDPIYKVNGVKIDKPVSYTPVDGAVEELKAYKFTFTNSDGTYVGMSDAGEFKRLNTAGTGFADSGANQTVTVVKS